MERFDFSSTEYTKFLTICPFTDEEIKILEMRRRGKSVVEIGLELTMSDRTVSRRIKSISRKIAKEI